MKSRVGGSMFCDCHCNLMLSFYYFYFGVRVGVVGGVGYLGL